MTESQSGIPITVIKATCNARRSVIDKTMTTAGKVKELVEGISGAAIQQEAVSTDLSTLAVGRYE